MKKVRIIIIGAGQRGAGYANYVLDHPDRAEVVAVADPQGHNRKRVAKQHHILPENVFESWEQVAGRPKFADAVVIATQDNMHSKPAIAFANLGYHILLEKPMAPTAQECIDITKAVKKAGCVFAVSHVLRYTPHTQKLKQIVDSGRIGEIVSIQHLEPVGFWHHAHSYVRGNWRNESQSSFMLMAKSCHDLDWIRYFTKAKCVRISSFGNLKHFRKENKPSGSADRCIECSVEASCPYSAKRLYLGMFESGNADWPVSCITEDISKDGILKALQTGPYGRCVYLCDNDVVDHQVVNMEFENGITTSFTMTAFTEFCDRKTRIFGTKGRIESDGSVIDIYDFLSDTHEKMIIGNSKSGIFSGHGGGDAGLMCNFIGAVATDNRHLVFSGPDETLESHLMVFAAEEARRGNCVISM